MSSKRRLRRRQCGRKYKYPTEAAAWAAIRARGVEIRPGSRPYRCRFCGRWHYGREPRKSALARRASRRARREK